jgi:hypothetical protein
VQVPAVDALGLLTHLIDRLCAEVQESSSARNSQARLAHVFDLPTQHRDRMQYQNTLVSETCRCIILTKITSFFSLFDILYGHA